MPFPTFQSIQVREERIFLTDIPVGDQLSTWLVFLADAVPRLDSRSSIRCVVKFTRQYGDEAHKLMEREGVAAGLLYCNFEEGVGQWVVVTHYHECKEDAVLG